MDRLGLAEGAITRLSILEHASVHAKIMSSPDPLRLTVWTSGIVLAIVATTLTPDASADAAKATVKPFAILTAIILGSVLADRLGAFRVLARTLVPVGASRVVSAAAVLVLTALLSALVNLDVAVVVAIPVALRASQHQGLSPSRLAVAVAFTANATSFLLPTSNITNLLLLGRIPLATTVYIEDSWIPWVLVTSITLVLLACWVGSARVVQVRTIGTGISARAVTDLIPMFLIASGVRALLGTHLALHGSFIDQVFHGAAICSAVSNLPAAAAILPAGTAGLWAGILATTIGPNFFITGSVATLISRRIARDGGADFTVRQFSAIGIVLTPAQIAAAALGLHVIGVLG